MSYHRAKQPRRHLLHRLAEVSSHVSTSTVPAVPSTRTRSPVLSRIVALPQPTTAGMPSSLATIAAWESGAPTSVITAAARGKSGVQPTLVIVVTSTSPGCSAAPSAASSMHPHQALDDAGRSREAAYCDPGLACAALDEDVRSPVRIGRPPVRVERPADQRWIFRKRRVRMIGGAAMTDQRRTDVSPCSRRTISALSRRKMSSPRSVNSPACSVYARSTQKYLITSVRARSRSREILAHARSWW